MSTLTVSLPTGTAVCNGKQITFRAPCDCAGVDGIVIDDTTYQLVDTNNESISNKGEQFALGAMVSVILDTDNSRAYIQNAAVDAIKPQIILDTLFASSWSDNTYSFESMYPKDIYDIEISVDGSATEDQINAFGSAIICGNYNSNIIIAKGNVPTEDIPIIIKVVKK